MPKNTMKQGPILRKGQAFKLEGLPELTKKMKRLQIESAFRSGTSERLRKNVKKALMTAALMVRDEVRDMAPVRSGLLRSAVFASYGSEHSPTVLVGVNHNKAPHSHLVEFGGRGGEMPKKPFLRPGIAAARPMAIRVVAEGLRNVLEEEAKS